MEAPEKIYLVNDDLNLKREWYKTKQVGFETTEYTRTDAFIEKVEKYLQEHLIDYWSQSVTDESKFIEDFKKYMEE